MLVLTRRVGESIQLFIKDELVAEITVVQVGGTRDRSVGWITNFDVTPVRLGIQAPNYVKILRSELEKKDN